MADNEATSYRRLADLLVGAKIAIALRAAAQHRVADKLAAGPISIEALAADTELAAEPLRRLLRTLGQFGIFKEKADGTFTNSEISEHMRCDVTPSLRDAILFVNHNVSLKAWLELENTLKDGESRFEAINGAPLFRLFDQDTQLSECFGKFMTTIYGPQAARIAAGYQFSQFDTMLDVGGGRGHVLAAILHSHANLKGAIFDNEPTAALANAFINQQGLEDRCEVLTGDFFVELPRGFDAYMVKSVLHDWNDATATDILRSCRKSMRTDSRLLIVEEIVVPGAAVGNPHKLVDLDLLVHFGGKERTLEEYTRLMNDAGFTVDRVAPVPDSFFSIIDGRPT